MSSWPLAHVEGGVRAAVDDTTSAASAASIASVTSSKLCEHHMFLQSKRALDLRDEFQIVRNHMFLHSKRARDLRDEFQIV